MISFFSETGFRQNYFWLGLGFLSQALFFLRFFVQWVVSEVKKESIIPISFWYFSILGGLGLLIYSIYRKDPVFIVGQFMGVMIYLRNLYLIRKKRCRNFKENAF